MITRNEIENLYKTYCCPPTCADELNVELLFQIPLEYHDIEIDDNANLGINSLPPTSSLRRIALHRINAIISIERWIAIILRSSIVFLNKYSSEARIHLRDFVNI